VFLIVFRRTLPLPADEAARAESSRDDGMGDDADDGAGREVSVFVDGAPTSSAQAQGRKVRRLYLLCSFLRSISTTITACSAAQRHAECSDAFCCAQLHQHIQ